MQDRTKHIGRMIVSLSALFVLISVLGLYLSGHYINSHLLESNINMAKDMSLLIENNFEITDAEAAYMKGLTFNEMEIDPVNKRLMEVGKDIALSAKVTNVYIVAPLEENEIRYTVSGEQADYFGYEDGTRLNGIWLLNGTIDNNGNFVITLRDDINRYTLLTELQKEGMNTREAFGEYSEDIWGNFITGYAPVYTTEGNFVGLLGIDMEPDSYQREAQHMILVMFVIFAGTATVLVLIFLLFYFRYTKAKEGQLAFNFYSQMSHDMRTPMNTILGLTDLSREEEDVQVLKENMEKIHQSGHYLLGLINDTLDYEKLTGSNFQLMPETISVMELIDAVCDIIRFSANEKGVNFVISNKDTDLSGYLNVDVMRMRQIFVNLLSNAVKFTPPGGTVELIIERIHTEGKKIHDRITVKDNGIGMSQDFINRGLFKPFTQEHNDITTNATGSGLGLSIVKKLVDLMGASLSVESKQGVGTSFMVNIDFELVDKPEKIEVKQKAGEKHTMEAASCSAKILLAEDHPLNAEITRKLLEKEGYQVVWAKDGKECVELFRESKAEEYALVLMDIRMPVMDGLEATRVIRALDRLDAKTIPIIAITANAYEEDKKQTEAAGMNEHLSKPIEPDLLKTKVEKYIQ